MTGLLKLIGILAVLCSVYYVTQHSIQDLFALVFVGFSLGFLILLFIVPLFTSQKSFNSLAVPAARTASDALHIGGDLPGQVVNELVDKCLEDRESITATAMGLNFKSLVLTNKRLIIVDVSTIPRLKIDSLKLESITGIETSSGAFTCGVTITLPGHEPIAISIDSQFYDQALELVSRIRRAIAEAEQSRAVVGADPLPLLQRLAELRDQGVLSSEEFETKKKELLNRV